MDATFLTTLRCADPLNMPNFYYQYQDYSFSFEPVVEVDSLVWSTIGPGLGLVAVEGERIYYRGDHFLSSDTTMLFYDFGLGLGDTAYFDTYSTYDHVVVTMVDTILLSGRERKRFFMNNEDIWVQGIGSLMDFFRPIHPTPLGCTLDALEFCGNYVDEAGAAYTVCSDFSVAIEEHATPPLRIVPNPSSEMIIVEGTRNGMPYSITDATGRRVLSGTSSEYATSIQIEIQQPGIYFLTAGSSVVRFVIGSR